MIEHQQGGSNAFQQGLQQGGRVGQFLAQGNYDSADAPAGPAEQYCFRVLRAQHGDAVACADAQRQQAPLQCRHEQLDFRPAKGAVVHSTE